MKTTVEGDITVGANVKAVQGSIEITSGKGEVSIGDSDLDSEAVTAGTNIDLTAKDGNVMIDGNVSTETGDITVIVENATYNSTGTENSIGFGTNGQLTSGKDAYLIAKNGDLVVTDDVTAEGTFYAQTKGQGDIILGENLDVENDLSMSTEKGDIIVGADVTATQGSVAMQAGEGTIYINESINAGENVSATVVTEGNVAVGAEVDAVQGSVTMQTGAGSVLVGQDITAGQGVSITSQQGDVLIGDPITGNDGDVLAKKGDVSIQTGQGYVGIVKTVTAQQGSIDIESGKGDILIGNNGPDDETVTAKQNVTLETANGKITVDGKTSTTDGDITLKAASETYVKGTAGQNIIINNDGITHNGIVDSGRDATLIAVNSDLQVTDNVKAKGSLNSKTQGMGNIILAKNINTEKEVSLQSDTGDITVGKNITANSVTLATGTGNITVGEDDGSGQKVGIITADNDVNINTGIGDVKIETSVESKAADVNVNVSNGNIHIGNNGPGVETVTAYKNIDIGVEQGQIEIYGKTSTKTGNISLSAAESQYIPGGQNIIIAQNGELDSAQDARLTGRNGDLRVTDAVKATRNLEVTVLDEGNIALERDVNVVGNTTITNTGRGNINGHDIVSGGTTHVSLTNGDLFLNLAEGKAVVLRMENNTAASRVNTVKADASGGAGLDVELTGNFIQIGTIEAKGGNSVLQLSAIGAGNQKLISGEISVGSLRSGNGTHMPSLWANRGNVHVDEGNLAIDDVLAKDKIHLENNLTDMAIFGRTPTRDGEQLYYWNNLSRAYDKQRSFQLYTDGKVRTRRAVLIDAGRYYDKLYGDNLSVVDMMRERLTHLHGRFAFDSALLTKRGEFLREKVLFGMDAVDTDIRKHNASNGELL